MDSLSETELGAEEERNGGFANFDLRQFRVSIFGFVLCNLPSGFRGRGEDKGAAKVQPPVSRRMH